MQKLCNALTITNIQCTRIVKAGNLCWQHRAQSKPIIQRKLDPLRTEDTGKIFEMAICLTFNTPYNGNYKYDINEAKALVQRLSRLKDFFPECSHTAEKGAQYDFTSCDDKHLSAKSTKKDGKVAPQLIGQPHPRKFCELIGIEYSNNRDLKRYIQENVEKILSILEKMTFTCPIVYWNQKTHRICYITQTSPILWNTFGYRWTCNWDDWNNSATLKIVVDGNVEYALLEVQFHSKSRKNMAVRWFFENLLKICSSHLNIVEIP